MTAGGERTILLPAIRDGRIGWKQMDARCYCFAISVPFSISLTGHVLPRLGTFGGGELRSGVLLPRKQKRNQPALRRQSIVGKDAASIHRRVGLVDAVIALATRKDEQREVPLTKHPWHVCQRYST